MRMLARVQFDPFEMDAVLRLQDHLKQNDIDLVLDPNHSRVDEPILNYINPYIRYSTPETILNMHVRSGFKNIFSKNVPISYMRNNCDDFHTTNGMWYYARPPADMIPILMVVHARDIYLNLTLNALVYSLQFDSEVPVHILMSSPTHEVRNVVDKFKNKIPNLFIYETETNVCLAGINILLQHLQPEKFIILEEDFILPQNLKAVMPYWNRIFNERLNYFDVVGFSTSVENSSADHFSVLTKTESKNTFTYNWKNIEGVAHVTGNTLCTTTQHYLKKSLRNPPFYITPDGTLMNSSKWSICSITGYHIGFNQEMDYGINLLNDSRFPVPAVDQVLIDRKSGEKFNYKLTDVFNLIKD